MEMEPTPRNPRSKVVLVGNGSSRGSRTSPLTGREIRGDAGGVIPVYRRSPGAAGCRLGEFVAGYGVNGASCYIVVSNSIPVLVPTLLDSRSFGSCTLSIGASGTNGGRSPESGPVSRSVSVLILRGRPGRSRGPGRLTTQVSAGYHAGQDAKPAPHRLPLLWGVRRRSPLRRSPAIGRWILSVGASHPAHPASGRLMGQVLRSSVSGRDAGHNYL